MVRWPAVPGPARRRGRVTACLFDTHLLLWAAEASPRLPRRAAALMNDAATLRLFSPLSIAEVSIKHAQRRPDFDVEPGLLRQALLDSDYVELPLTAAHAALVGGLPRIHKDPFDRLLIAQATAEGVVFVTADARLAAYGEVARVVG